MKHLVYYLFGTAFIALAVMLTCGEESAPPASPPLAKCSVSATDLSFGPVTVGTPADQQFTLTNSGGGTLAGTLVDSCEGFEIVGNASYNLGAGESKTFTVRFSPTTATAYTCTLSTDQSACQVACQGTGIAQTIACTLLPTSLDYGNVKVGDYLNQAFDITNQGSDTLSGTVSESCPNFSLVGTTSYTLAPGERALFIVRFNPVQDGAHSCTIATGAPGCPTVSCIGTGWTPNPFCQVVPNGLSFAELAVGDRADATFEVTNNGTTNLVGTVSETCPEFSIPGETSYDLAPGASQTFIVRFAPTATGQQSCDITVGSGCRPVSCDGRGVIGCTYTPANIDLGYRRRGDVRCGTLKLKNNTARTQEGELLAAGRGSRGYPVGVIKIDGVVAGESEGLSYTLTAGQSRDFYVCWETRDAMAPCDTNVVDWTIRSTACSGVTASIRGVLTRGCGCTVTPTALDFGNIVVGDVTGWQSIAISNESGIEGLSGSVRVVSGDDFEATTEYTCPAESAPIGCSACGSRFRPMSVFVRFKPSRLGPQTGKIVIENLEGCIGPGSSAICDTVTVTGVGVLTPPR
jgi:hypothetical protein